MVVSSMSTRLYAARCLDYLTATALLSFFLLKQKLHFIFVSVPIVKVYPYIFLISYANLYENIKVIMESCKGSNRYKWYYIVSNKFISLLNK